jgi:hypothetical protein
MKTFEIGITRTSYSTKKFIVEAEDNIEAVIIAMEQAYNEVFDEDTADYSVEDIQEKVGSLKISPYLKSS